MSSGIVKKTKSEERREDEGEKNQIKVQEEVEVCWLVTSEWKPRGFL